VTISLRLVRETDLDLVREWRQKPSVTTHMYTDPVISVDSQLKWFERIVQSRSDIVWLIWHGEERIGLISLNSIDQVSANCSWAYYIGEDSARGIGLAKTLECNIANFVFYHLRLNKLWCEVFSENQRVVDLHVKYGSAVEGIFVQQIKKGGRFYDVVRLGLLESNWKQVSKSFVFEAVKIETPQWVPNQESC
jgi:UDP-4-amino-4,6-dideoxy-N-acetyl-beta-L-altrosamine N-acetyltransferase